MPRTGSAEELWLYQDTVGGGRLVWGPPDNPRGYKPIGKYIDGQFVPSLND